MPGFLKVYVAPSIDILRTLPLGEITPHFIKYQFKKIFVTTIFQPLKQLPFRLIETHRRVIRINNLFTSRLKSKVSQMVYQNVTARTALLATLTFISHNTNSNDPLVSFTRPIYILRICIARLRNEVIIFP